MATFTARECRRCYGDGIACDETEPCVACAGTGRFLAELREGWAMPVPPNTQCYLEAVFDDNEWSWLGWRTVDGEEYGEIDWPFARPWADAEDLEALGFIVESG